MSETLSFADGAVRGGDWPAYGVIGDPIEHSLSPRLHTAALAARGATEDYRAIRVQPADLGRFLAVACEAGMRGLNVTIPHKTTVLAGCVRASEEVQTIGAANTLVARGGEWVAHNTDARGLAVALSRSLGRRLADHLDTGVVLGAGGAARAAVVTLRSLGVRQIWVLARDAQRAAWVGELDAAWAPFESEHPARASILIQATPVGLHPEDPCPIDEALVPRGAMVMDLVYGPQPSRLLEVARSRGCVGEDGRPMLVAQAALAFALWFGAEAPLPAMAAAVGIDW